MAPTFNVAVFLYPGADVMDFTGPVEVYSTRPADGSASRFKIHTFAHNNPVNTGSLVYVPSNTFEDVEQRLSDFDFLVVPGAHPDVLDEYIPSEEGKRTIGLIAKFATLPPRKETGHRVLQSVCSGALLLAAAGILAGRTVTTHHICYDALKRIADQVSGGDAKVEVVRKRWVDAGFTGEGVRIVNAGGVSSGIDTSLWLVEMLLGKEAFEWTQEIMEFERRGEADGWGVKKA